MFGPSAIVPNEIIVEKRAGPDSSEYGPQTLSQQNASSDPELTPMMAQYLTIKAEHPDCLLFYRMGDFYEMFFDDAVTAAATLDIALTKRGKHLGADIPMCGVPVHSHDAYLNRLIRRGHRVAVCEQMENPAEARKRGAKSVVRRGVVRVVTPGTLTEDSLLDSRRHNFLAAVAEAEQRLGLAWVDVSTGAFETQSVVEADLAAALARLAPGELLVSENLYQRPDLFEVFGDMREQLTPLPAAKFDSAGGARRLCGLFQVGALDAFGDFSRAEVAAAGALVEYIKLTQKGNMPRLATPRRLAAGAVMKIDPATRRNLELTTTLAGDAKGSLLAILDRTVTGAGARLLALRLAQPLTDPAAIEARLDAVTFFVADERLSGEVREALKQSPDIARALSRLSLGRGGPRDLAAIRDGLSAAAALRQRLDVAADIGLPPAVEAARVGLGFHAEVIDRLGRALAADLPLLARDGGFIARGYSERLDQLIGLRDESRKLIAGLQARYIEETTIAGLKVKHNNVLGYFIEVSSKQADAMPSGADCPYIHRQTMANAVRYGTVELGDLEARIAQAADRALALELELFGDLVGDVVGRGEQIAEAAEAEAIIDVSAALARLAVERRYVRPVIEDSLAFDVVGGRHPVVEAALDKAGGEAFVANDCRLGSETESADGRLWLLTGPNMAGKSTFLRQNALIAVIAQTGSYVPADAATIGVVDRLFSRVGASDDLARGHSTFMVEMVETATILNQAGPRSLVILDEIGRGTATYDGLSIAWAVVEHLHQENQCRALFATHYHELTALAGKLENLQCHTMRVKEWQGDVVFLHEVGHGVADRSYGIHVGKLAGLPPSVVARAEIVLDTLEQSETSSAVGLLAEDLPLFQAAPAITAAPIAGNVPSLVEMAVDEICPDELTPRTALDFVYDLKRILSDIK